MATVNEVLWCFLQYTRWFSDAISASMLGAFKDVFGKDYTQSNMTSPAGGMKYLFFFLLIVVLIVLFSYFFFFFFFFFLLSATMEEHLEYKRKKEVRNPFFKIFSSFSFLIFIFIFFFFQMAISKFLKKIASQNQSFVEKFIQTQMFTEYCEKKERQKKE